MSQKENKRKIEEKKKEKEKNWSFRFEKKAIFIYHWLSNSTSTVALRKEAFRFLSALSRTSNEVWKWGGFEKSYQLLEENDFKGFMQQ